MTYTTVFGPALDQQNKLLSTRVKLTTLRQKSCVVQRDRCIHREVDGNGICSESKRSRCQQSHLGLFTSESGPPKLETTNCNQTVSACTDGHLSQLVFIICNGLIAGFATQALHECHWIHVGYNVNFGNSHTKCLVPAKTSTGKTHHLNFGNDGFECLFNTFCQPLNYLLVGGSGCYLTQKLHSLR